MRKKKPAKLPDHYRLGPFRLGFENVEFFIVPEMQGGEYFLCPNDSDCARIKVGFGDDWAETLSYLLHEAMEFALTRHNARLVYTNKISGDSANCVFHFDHSLFHQCTVMVAKFCDQVIPVLRQKFDLHKSTK